MSQAQAALRLQGPGPDLIRLNGVGSSHEQLSAGMWLPMLRARSFVIAWSRFFDAQSMKNIGRVRIEFCTRSVLDETLGLML